MHNILDYLRCFSSQEAGKSDLTSSGCHQVIFLLSDEIEDFQGTKKVIDHHKDMEVRAVPSRVRWNLYITDTTCGTNAVIRCIVERCPLYVVAM